MRAFDPGPPSRLRLPSFGASVALWTLVVAAAATWLHATRRDEALGHALDTSALQLEAVAARLDLTFGQLSALPRDVAQLDAVQRYLAVGRFPEPVGDADRRRLHERLLRDPAMQAMNASLNRLAADFELPVLLLIDAGGNVVANGSSARRAGTAPLAEPYIGTLGDRRYFADALSHGSGAQFIAGRLTGTTGIVFSHRVDHEGSAVGVAAVRQDIDVVNRLLPPIEEARVYVTDRNGVVVLANRTPL